MFPKQFFLRILRKCTTRYGYENQPIVAVLNGVYDWRDAIPKECAEIFVDVEFEGRRYKAIRGYDTWLTNVYGDYMKLPPEDERVARHNFKAYWK